MDLHDAIHLLPPTAVTLLQAEPSGVQEFVVEAITACLNYWEDHHVILDPITREAVLDSLVAIHIATCKSIAGLLVSAREEHNASCGGRSTN